MTFAVCLSQCTGLLSLPTCAHGDDRSQQTQISMASTPSASCRSCMTALYRACIGADVVISFCGTPQAHTVNGSDAHVLNPAHVPNTASVQQLACRG